MGVVGLGIVLPLVIQSLAVTHRIVHTPARARPGDGRRARAALRHRLRRAGTATGPAALERSRAWLPSRHDVVHDAAVRGRAPRDRRAVLEPLPRRHRPRPRAARRLRPRGPRPRRLRRLQLGGRLARDRWSRRRTRARTSSSRATSTGGTHPLKAWLVFEVLGVFAGALLSGLLAGRVRGHRSRRGRACRSACGSLLAFAGGALMAVGAALARGCTSGQALTGGALLNLGSWAFMMMRLRRRLRGRRVHEEAVAMSAPFYKYGAFGDEASLVVAFLIGIGFGFFLERAGLRQREEAGVAVLPGRPRGLQGDVHRDRDRDARRHVPRLDRASWTCRSSTSCPTYWVAQVVGGLVLGVGFVVGGYCPGTSLVSTATGKLDGLVFVLGFAAGTLGFAVAFPLVKGLYLAGDAGHEDAAAGHSACRHGVLVFAVVLMAVGGFAGATWVERLDGAAPSRPRPSGVGGDHGTLAVEPHPQPEARRSSRSAWALVAVFATVTPAQTVTVDAKELLTSVERREDHVTPQELAAWIIEGRADYRLDRHPRREGVRRVPHPHRRERPARDGRRRCARPHRQARPLRRRRHPRRAGVDGPQGPGLHVRLHAARGPRRVEGRGPLPRRSPRTPSPEEQARFERAAQVARFFGGQPRAAAAPGGEPGPRTTLAAPAMPSVAPPTLPGGGGATAPRKKKEGC